MLVILDILDIHNFPIVQTILIKFVTKFMVYRALSYKTYMSLVLRSPLRYMTHYSMFK